MTNFEDSALRYAWILFLCFLLSGPDPTINYPGGVNSKRSTLLQTPTCPTEENLTPKRVSCQDIKKPAALHPAPKAPRKGAPCSEQPPIRPTP